MNGSMIFISYRREDTAGSTGRLCDFLEKKLGKNSLFHDVDTVPFGQDFISVITSAIDRCSLFIIMVGGQFTKIKTPEGKPKIFLVEDYVRFELEYALKKNKIIIPVLVDDAIMPERNELPNDLHKITRLNAVRIRNSNWKNDCRSFYNHLQKEYGEKLFLEIKNIPERNLVCTLTAPYKNSSLYSLLFSNDRKIVASVFNRVSLNATSVFISVLTADFGFKQRIVISKGYFIWSIETGKIIGTINEKPIADGTFKILLVDPKGSLWGLVYDPGGLVFGSKKYSVVEWDIISGKRIFETELKYHKSFSEEMDYCVSILDSSMYLFNPDKGCIEKLHLPSGKVLNSLEQSNGYSHPKITADGRLLSSLGLGGYLKVWDLVSESIIIEIKEPIDSYVFSEINDCLATISSGTVKIWNTYTAEKLYSFEITHPEKEDIYQVGKKHKKHIQSIIGDNVILMTRGQIEGWNIKTGQMVMCHTTTGYIDNDMLAHIEDRDKIKVWQLKSLFE